MIQKFGEIEDNTAKKVQITYNYHTHNYLCGHAVGTVSDYAEVAVRNRLCSLGISDHFAHPALRTPYMDLATLKNEYLPQFSDAEATYGKQIKLYSGLEIEYLAGYDGLYKELLQNVDYLILGEHAFLHEGKIVSSFEADTDKSHALSYFQCLIEGVKTGYFSILAHPDVIFIHGFEPDKEVLRKFEDAIRCCADYGVKAEINGQGARGNGFGYPTDYLLEICQKLNASVVVSADSHSPEALCDLYTKKLYCVARDMGLNIAEDGFIKKRK